MGDMHFLSQLIDSMSDAVDKLEQAKNSSKITEFNQIKNFILQIQTRIKEELVK